jgi:hypothetical protein
MYMDQHQPCVHKIERPWLRGWISGDVVLAHLIPIAYLQPRGSDVRSQHVSGRTDERRECFRNTGTTGSHFPAVCSCLDPQSLDVPKRHTVEQLGEPDESLARLGARVVQQVAVGGSGVSAGSGSPTSWIRPATNTR